MSNPLDGLGISGQDEEHEEGLEERPIRRNGSSGKKFSLGKLLSMPAFIKGKAIQIIVLVVLFLVAGMSLLVFFGKIKLPSIQGSGPVASSPKPQVAPTPAPQVEPQVVVPGITESEGIGLADVSVIGFLQWLIMLITLFLLVTFYMQARDRENVEDFRATIFSLCLANVPLVTSFLKRITEGIGGGVWNSGLSLGLVVGVALSGGLSLFPIGMLFAFLALMMFLTGQSGSLSYIIPPGKVYPFLQFWRMIEHKNMEMAKFSLFLYGFLILAVILLVIEELRQRQTQGVLIISLGTVGAYELFAKALGRPEFALIVSQYGWIKFVPLVAAAGILVTASMFLRRYGKGVFSIGGDVSRVGTGQHGIGSPWTSVGFSLLIGSLLLIASG